jgi:hypothetical protein
VKEFVQLACEMLGITIEWTGEGAEAKGIDKATGKVRGAARRRGAALFAAALRAPWAHRLDGLLGGRAVGCHQHDIIIGFALQFRV